MRLNIAVQMDPIERISIRGDSTFALLLEAQKRGHGIAYYTPDRLALLGAKVVANVQPLKVRDQQGDHFTLGEARRTELTEFDVVLLRQDPPFDLAYITTTHLLERIQPGTLVVNEPSAVRNAPAKIPARGQRRRQAHPPGRWRVRRRGEPGAGARRSALEHGARRYSDGNRADCARARHLRSDRPGFARARAPLRRHRRDRRLSHR